MEATSAAEQQGLLGHELNTQRFLLTRPLVLESVAEPATTPAFPESSKRAEEVAREVDYETELWALFAQKRFDEIEKRIAVLREQGWQPPLHLLRSVIQARENQGVEWLVRSDYHQRLIEYANDYPHLFACEQIHRLWALLAAYAAEAREELLIQRLQWMGENCPSAEHWRVTLQKARAWLDDETILGLLALRPETTASDPALAQIQFAVLSQLAADAFSVENYASVVDHLFPYSEQILQQQDLGSARLLAWSLIRLGREKEALTWFLQTAMWSGDEQDRLTLAQWFWSEGLRTRAARIALELFPESAEAQEFLGRISLQRAQEALDSDDDERALHNFKAAEYFTELNASHWLSRAWAWYRLDEFTQAASAFEHSYQLSPSKSAAQGLSFSQFQRRALVDFQQQVHQYGGFLHQYGQALLPYSKTTLEDYLQRDLWALDGRGRIVLKQELLPKAQAYWQSQLRQKGLVAGLDSFLGWINRFDYRFPDPVDWDKQWGVDVEFALLSSSPPQLGDRLGSYDAAATRLLQHNAADDIGLSLLGGIQHQHWPLRHAALGVWLTPNAVDGIAQLEWQMTTTSRLKFTRQPKTDSRLSYLGLSDPYHPSLQLGPVLENKLSWQSQWRAWNLDAGFSELSGTQVKSNLAVSLYAQRDLAALPDWKGFVFYNAYAHNLGHFTLGHGGYYSPQAFLQIGVNSPDWPLGDSHWLQARVAWQWADEAAAELFPLKPNGESYAAKQQQGLAAELNGKWLLGDAKQLLARYQHSPGFDELQLNLQWLF